MTKVTKILSSGGACPYQLSALTECGREIYLRYRGGHLRWGFLDNPDRLTPTKYEFSQVIGNEYDGSANDATFKIALKDSLEFPEGFSFEREIYE
jgi:hypothetical protein